MDTNELLALLADGAFHSGERLGTAAGLTRAAVWKHIRKLGRWGLEVEAGSGRGYRLTQSIELLNGKSIHAALSGNELFEFDRVDVFVETGSTNQYLLENPPTRAGVLRVCLAEWQSSGRGRLERPWVSPLGSGICISAGWIFSGTPQNFSALSLAAGAAIADVIAQHCGVNVRLKWPNDIVWGDCKLGGVLVESRIESHALCHVVIGMGINFSVPDAVLAELSDWPAGAVDLRTATSGADIGRNALATKLSAELGALFSSFARNESARWLDRWRELDYLRGKAICVSSAVDSFDGLADGIDDDGALLVIDSAGIRQRVVAGDARVRTQ